MREYRDYSSTKSNILNEINGGYTHLAIVAERRSKKSPAQQTGGNAYGGNTLMKVRYFLAAIAAIVPAALHAQVLLPSQDSFISTNNSSTNGGQQYLDVVNQTIHIQ